MDQHSLDQSWVHVIRNVRIGTNSSRKRFVESVSVSVRTERQRWYLAKLVVMYRRQISSDFAVASAQAYLDLHPELDQYPKKEKVTAVKPAPAPPPRNLDLFGEWS